MIPALLFLLLAIIGLVFIPQALSAAVPSAKTASLPRATEPKAVPALEEDLKARVAQPAEDEQGDVFDASQPITDYCFTM
ncbi:hypothetical protein B7494_g7090 [Chlorociboria aeruginascens]|nr:hypothetical protein B7494_g7090 [Chlorociboria aeruginascens]